MEMTEDEFAEESDEKMPRDVRASCKKETKAKLNSARFLNWFLTILRELENRLHHAKPAATTAATLLQPAQPLQLRLPISDRY